MYVFDIFWKMYYNVLQDYYKTGLINCPPSVQIPELREACDYLLIPFNAQVVRCQNLSKLFSNYFQIATINFFWVTTIESIILKKLTQGTALFKNFVRGHHLCTSDIGLNRSQSWWVFINNNNNNARCHLLKEYALSEYKAQSWAKAVMPFVKLYYIWPILNSTLAFFPQLKVKFLKK